MDPKDKLDAIRTALARVQAQEASLLGDDGASVTDSPAVRVGFGLASLTGSLALGYHGYKRNNDSVAWGLGWWFLGGAFPVGTAIGAVLAWDQGFAKPLPLPAKTA